jgi:hypothetical protein
MEVKSELFPDNFSINLNSSGAVLRYSLRIPRDDIGNLLTKKDTKLASLGVKKSKAGNYMVVIEKSVSHVTNESILKQYHSMKLEAMNKSRLLKIQSIEIELKALNHGQQLELKF